MKSTFGKGQKSPQEIEKVSDFQVAFDDNIYLSIGLEAKCDIYNSLDPNEPYDIH